jgi:hypothetical protein
MPRALLLVGALVLAAALAGGCDVAVGGGSGVSAEDVEAELAENGYGAARFACEDVDEGWDFVCTYTDVDGRRLKVGLRVDGRDLDRVAAA